MSINPSTQYPGKIDTTDPVGYPYGKGQNITTPGDGTGTPWEKALLNDLFGLQQALLKSANITPDGTPDKFGASQYLQSLVELASGRAFNYTGGGTANAQTASAKTAQQAPASYFAGMVVQYTPTVANTGSTTLNVAGLGVKNIIDDITGAALVGGEMGPTKKAVLEYDGVEFRLINPIQFINWLSPQAIGQTLSIAVGSTPSIARMTNDTLAFYESAIDQLRAYKFNGQSWTLVGTGFNLIATSFSAMTALSETDVAFINSTGDSLLTFRFNGSTWSQIGSGLSVPNVLLPALTALNSTDVAFTDNNNDQLRTYRFNGSTWSLVGSGLTIAGVGGSVALATLNSTDVAFIDGANLSLRTYRFNGSTWSLVGTGLTIAGISQPAITALNNTDIVLSDATTDELNVYRFNGSTWVKIGATKYIAGAGASGVTAMNGFELAYLDATNDQLLMFRYGFQIGQGPYTP